MRSIVFCISSVCKTMIFVQESREWNLKVNVLCWLQVDLEVEVEVEGESDSGLVSQYTSQSKATRPQYIGINNTTSGGSESGFTEPDRRLFDDVKRVPSSSPSDKVRVQACLYLRDCVEVWCMAK